MRLFLLLLALGVAPNATAQADLSAELAAADSVTAAFTQFVQAFSETGRSMPDSVDVLGFGGWGEVRERGVGVFSAIERGFGWSQVLPLMECDSDKHVILT